MSLFFLEYISFYQVAIYQTVNTEIEYSPIKASPTALFCFTVDL